MPGETDYWSLTKTYHHKPYPAIDPSRPELSARGKVVVVVGASRGIGASIAESFAKAGAAHLIITGRNVETLEQLKTRLENSYRSNIHPIAADVTDNASMISVFSSAAEKFGKIDVTVVVAGDSVKVPVKDMAPETLMHVFQVNTIGHFNTAQAFLRVAASNAVLIEINTGIAHTPPGWGPVSIYAASKAATAKLYEYIQDENPDLRVFIVHPGIIATEMATTVNTHMSAQEYPDSVDLPGAFCTWLASGQADFLKGKFLWANWDVDEMKQREKEILADPSNLTLSLGGWGM